MVYIEPVCLNEQLARGTTQQKSVDSKASIENYSEDLHDGFRIKYPDGGPTTSELFKHFIGQALLPGVTWMVYDGMSSLFIWTLLQGQFF